MSKAEQILDLRRSGKTLRQIAAIVGCDKAYCSQVCRPAGLGGAIIEQRLIESQVAEYVSRSGFDYVGGYTNGRAPVTVRCRECGRTFDRQFHIFRDVVNGTWKNENECPLCKEDRKKQKEQEKEEQKQQRKIKAEHEAQKIAERKAERLNRKISNELTKRLAIHVCKNCGVEFTQAITGYNSEAYCSKKCQIRWYNRKSSEKRYKTLMSREHDSNISLEQLFKRDSGICYLCGKACEWNDGEERDGTFIAGDYYPSIDHVVPVSKGGTHTWENIKLAHRRCNLIKRDS